MSWQLDESRWQRWWYGIQCWFHGFLLLSGLWISARCPALTRISAGWERQQVCQDLSVRLWASKC